MRTRFAGALSALGIAATLGAAGAALATEAYSPTELATLRSLWIGSLGPLPDDPSNAYDTDPRAAALGRRFFFDTGFSANGALSCASCHPAELGFQDRKPVAEGLGPLARRSMPLAGVAYNTWFFWDGRKDSLWSQATTPLENPVELGATRPKVAARIAAHYRSDYEAIFGPLPTDSTAGPAADRVFVNVAKAIAAFERTIQPQASRFDRYVEALQTSDAATADALLSAAEIRGLRLFIGKAKCINCHAGPLLTNGEFEFTRVPLPTPDPGRGGGIPAVQKDEFSCTGRYSDANPDQCTALRFMITNARDGQYAFKTPSLRNVASRAPYMHAGQFATLAEVLRFYRDGTAGISEMGHGGTTDAELADLEAFLGTLTGPIAALPAPIAALPTPIAGPPAP